MAETPPNRPRLRDMLEPGAINPGFPASERDTAWEIEIEASKAISLKRIADAFDASPDGGRPQGSVLYWLEIIASAANAGRS